MQIWKATRSMFWVQAVWTEIGSCNPVSHSLCFVLFLRKHEVRCLKGNAYKIGKREKSSKGWTWAFWKVWGERCHSLMGIRFCKGNPASEVKAMGVSLQTLSLQGWGLGGGRDPSTQSCLLHPLPSLILTPTFYRVSVCSFLYVYFCELANVICTYMPLCHLRCALKARARCCVDMWVVTSCDSATCILPFAFLLPRDGHPDCL